MTALRLLLNSPLSGANLFFALGQTDGSFRAAGLDLALTPGRGAWTAAGRLLHEGFDLAYGDIHALVHLAQRKPTADLPQAICALHQHAPTVIAVPQRSAIRTPAQLRGARIVGHASDVALQTFAPFARAAGIDAAAVEVRTSDQTMAELLRDLLAGRHDAVFGYASTHTAALATLGLDADRELHFLHYRDICPRLYGSALMASAALLRDAAGPLADLVQVLRAKVEQAQRHPELALDALQTLAPGLDRAIEARRWAITCRDDMGLATAPGSGWGRFDVQRLAGAIADVAAGCGWDQVPAATRIATPGCLIGPE